MAKLILHIGASRTGSTSIQATLARSQAMLLRQGVLYPRTGFHHRTHHLLCPCHQSTFDLADSGNVIFGPAARRMPQLPIGVDDEGYLVALADFAEPVGPSFWERG